MRKGPKVAAILLSLSLSRVRGGLGLSREGRDLGSLPCMLGSSDRDTTWHLQELLAEWQLQKHPRSACGQLWQAVMLALGGLLCLGTTVGCAAAVLTFSEVMMQVRQGTDRPGAETPTTPLGPWFSCSSLVPVSLELKPGASCMFWREVLHACCSHLLARPFL